MHDPVEVHSESGSDIIADAEVLAEAETQGLSIDPTPVNPISFALLSALIGMAGGLLLARGRRPQRPDPPVERAGHDHPGGAVPHLPPDGS